MTAGRWERAAEQYATGEHKSGDELRVAVEFAAPKGTERVLDIGAGAGHMALAMAPRVASVILTDPVDAMLDAARGVFRQAGIANADYIKAAAEALPFEAVSFDLVTTRLAAHHLISPSVRWRACSSHPAASSSLTRLPRTTTRAPASCTR
jgi:ubiquinone/menaquinone biosynthesis C-methylase UbiE